jgi:hypothetical protein
MAINANTVEALAQLCLISEAFSDIHSKARSEFFGYDEPGNIEYLEGTGDSVNRERRFMGWFSFYYKLPDGRRPAELVAASLLKGSDLEPALKAIQGTRYVQVIVKKVIPGYLLDLELEDEIFEVNNKYLSHQFHEGDTLTAFLLPAGRNGWIIGPGWVVLSIRIGPGMRKKLKSFQPAPIEMERLLQQRVKNDEKPHTEIPRDQTLRKAVNRMNKSAREAGKQNLARSTAEWKKLVISCMSTGNFNKFARAVYKWTGKCASLEEINKWIGLATNIWNNIPQPDRGNLSANQLVRKNRRKKLKSPDLPEAG